MDTALVNGAGTVQLIALAVILIFVIVLGARFLGQGAKGYGSLLGEVGGLLVAIWFIARPNDAISLLLKLFGGIAKPVMPS